jgi:hypothetical protein
MREKLLEPVHPGEILPEDFMNPWASASTGLQETLRSRPAGLAPSSTVSVRSVFRGIIGAVDRIAGGLRSPIG